MPHMFVFDQIAKVKSNVSCCQLISADVSWFFWHRKLLIDINVHSSAFVSTILSTNWILEKKLSFWKFWKFWEFTIFKNSNFWPKIRIQGLKLSEKHAPYVCFWSNCQIQVQCQLTSADFWQSSTIYFYTKSCLFVTI